MLALDLGGLIRASTLAVIGVLGSFGAEPCHRRIRQLTRDDYGAP
jgi:hypothetical protein